MRQYSIIVPTIGNQVEFEATLASVLRYLPAGSEVIVPCSHDYDDVHGLDGEVRLVRLDAKSKPELPQLFRVALENSGRELVGLFLPGVEIVGEWQMLVSPQFDNPEIAAVSPTILSVSQSTVQLANRGAITGFRIDRQHGRRIVNATKRRTELPIDGPLALAAIFRNDAFGWLEMDKTGLTSESLEVELAAGLKQLGYRANTVSEWFVSCESTVLENWKQSRMDGDDQERVIRRHFASGIAGLSFRIVLDLLTGRMGSAFGRLLSMRHGRRDLQFNQRLMQGKLEREKLCKTLHRRSQGSAHSVSDRRVA